MADVRPFRALRYDSTKVDLAKTIAPPYDVISPEQQASLYDRSPYNIVRVEYGEERPGDTSEDNRYTRAAADLSAWRETGILSRPDRPSFYVYDLEFEWEGKKYSRKHVFGLVRLEEWEKGVVKPHEHTLSGPKADRMELLRATRTQISPVYCLYQGKSNAWAILTADSLLYDFKSEGQRHRLTAYSSNDTAIDWLQEMFERSDFYIADGHHRYETALAYRNECRDATSLWTGDEPENFVLMAMTAAFDDGLLVLPTHRVVHRPMQSGGLSHIRALFDVEDIGSIADHDVHRLDGVDADVTAFITLGLEPDRAHLLVLRDRPAAEALMPRDQAGPWKRLDVNVLQYAILEAAFGIDEGALKAGGAVSYVQQLGEAVEALRSGNASAAFLLNATPVDQIIAVSDVDGRMPQKSTYFYPKLPTGLVLHPMAALPTDEPRISIALCTFNGSEFLGEQLESLGGQSVPASEIVVCDDASSDNTVEIVEAFASTRPFPVGFQRNEQNVGVSRNFEQAVRLCAGDYIALADQDDIWFRDKLAGLYLALLNRPDAAYAFCDARLMDESKRVNFKKTLVARRFALASIEGKFREGREFDLMLKRDFIYGTTLMIRASARELVLPIAPGWSHDTWIVNVLAAFGERGVPVLEPLVLYRQHGVQASGGMSAPKTTTYEERVSAYEALKSHLDERSATLGRALAPGVVERIDEKLRYLRAMRDMQALPLHRRAAAAAGEVASGRWWRYTPRTFLVDKRFDFGRLPGFRS